jgi:hypothetical protein
MGEESWIDAGAGTQSAANYVRTHFGNQYRDRVTPALAKAQRY